jgi:hypothetical protein
MGVGVAGADDGGVAGDRLAELGGAGHGREREPATPAVSRDGRPPIGDLVEQECRLLGAELGGGGPSSRFCR